MSKLQRPARLVFAGGGTGGHLFPAIAIAEKVKSLLQSSGGAEIIFVGTKRGIEYRLRESLNFPLRTINVRGLARRISLSNLLVPFLFISALLKSRSLLKEFNPDIVVGTGGYVSLPVLKAASMLNIPTAVQEQNSFPGIATRQLASAATKVFLGFDRARDFLGDKNNLQLTGNPVRAELTTGDRSEAISYFGLNPARKTILVIGGSQGARAINNAVLKSLDNQELNENYQILWQTGKRDYKDVIAQAGERAKVHSLFPFENRMDLVYAAADIAIARAGALTLAELQASAVPMVLVPLPGAAGDHQTKNAQEFCDNGFAQMIVQSDLESNDPIQHAIEMFEDGTVTTISESLHADLNNKKAAVDIIAENIIGIIEINRNTEKEN